MKVSVMFVLVLFVTSSLWAQNDSISKQKMEEFVVSGEPVPIQIFAIQPIQKMDKEQIKRITTYQLSDVIKHFAGTIVKDYGGIGGMKTVSVRGLGSQHTGVLYNGIALSDCQTGQIDIGKLSLDFIETITLSNGPNRLLLATAREHSFGAVLNLTSENPVFQPNERNKFHALFSLGSFGLINTTLKFNHRVNPLRFKNWNVITSLQSNYTRLNGNYPFTLYFGGNQDSTSKEYRINSDVQSVLTEGSILWSHKKRRELFRVHLFYYHSEKGLPGAVLFYNNVADQRLWDANLFIQTRYTRFFTKKWGYSNAFKFNHSYIRYLDPSYLNETGRLDNRYRQNESYISNNISYLGDLFDFALAHDLFYNDLRSNIAQFSFPSRLSSLTAFSGELHYKWLKMNFNLLHTLVFNQTKTGSAAPNNNKISPTVGFSIKPCAHKQFYVRAFFKNIFRLPTFNDLYYREIGNINLKPENTYQYSVGTTYFVNDKKDKWRFSYTLDGYFNIIYDKIVAIPSRNLFVWSMINYGIVHTYGADLTIQTAYTINQKIQMAFMASYSFQKAIDKTTPGSKTYDNQLPYTPLHSGSYTISLLTFWFDLNYSAIISGDRYVTGQNIPQNLLSGYIDHSISIGRAFLLPHSKNTTKPKIGIRMECLNVTNSQYQIVRNYPMPGTSYNVKIQFHF